MKDDTLLLESLTFVTAFRGLHIEEGQGMVTALIGEKEIGALRWDYYAEPPVVLDITVDEPHQRRGVATALFNHAKAQESQLVHSSTLTPDGAAFVASLRA